MKTSSVRSFLGFLALAVFVAIRVDPRTGSTSHATVMKSYTPFAKQGLHRRGCLDPHSREINRDVDVVRLAVDEETTLVVTLHGDQGLEPGFVVTADEGAAATQSWMRERGSRGGDDFSTIVVLPTAGAYSFVIADRRELTGDEMAAGKGCFTADFQPTAPLEPQVLPSMWRGTVGVPVSFSAPRRGRDLSLVEVAHTGGDGIVMVSVFEDGRYARTTTLAPKGRARLLVTTRADGTRILVEEAANWGREPLRVMVRAIPSAIAPDLEVEPTGKLERLAASIDESFVTTSRERE